MFTPLEVELFERLTIACEKFADAGEKAAELMGAAVSQLDEIRAEVTKQTDIAKGGSGI